MAVNTYGYMRRLAFAAVAATALIGPANAFTVGTEPLGGVNDVFGPAIGYYGANVYVTGAATIQYTLIGYEAGFTNTFTSGAHSLSGGNGQLGTLSAPIGTSFTQTILGPQLLNFAFTTSGGGAPDVNGSNPDGSTTSVNVPNFFLTFFNSTNTALGAFPSGQGALLAFDDGGGGTPRDGDYDDLVIEVQILSSGSPGTQIAPVPEASTWAMMLMGFAGLGFLAYRRKQNVTFRLV